MVYVQVILHKGKVLVIYSKTAQIEGSIHDCVLPASDN